MRTVRPTLLVVALAVGVSHCSRGPSNTATDVGGVSSVDRPALDPVAAQGLSLAQTLLQQSDLAGYGLSSAADIGSLTLGGPVPVHVLTPAQLNAHVSGAPVRDIMGPYGQVYYPVQLGGTTRFVVMLTRTEDQTGWEYYGFGKAPLAQRLDSFLSHGAAVDLLVQPQAKATLGLWGAGGAEQLVYLIGGGSGGPTPMVISPGPSTDTVIAQLQQAVAVDSSVSGGTGP
jgi:hypothetical protein